MRRSFLFTAGLICLLFSLVTTHTYAQESLIQGRVTEITSETRGKILLDNEWSLTSVSVQGTIFEIRNGVYLPIASIKATRESGQRYSYVVQKVSGSLKPYQGALVSLDGAVKKTDTGKLEIRSDPPGARVYLDGNHVSDKITPMTLDVSPGEHTLRVVYGGYIPEEQTVLVNPLRDSAVSFKLKRLEGKLTVYTTPDTVSVSVTGQSLNYSGRGNTGANGFSRRLQPGTYRIRLEKNGYEPYDTTVEVTSRTPALEVELNRIHAPVFITSTPPGAAIYSGNEQIGITPDTLRLSVGPHEIRLEKKGYATAALSLSVSARPVTPPVHVDLQATTVAFYLESTPSQAQIWIDGLNYGVTPDTLRLAPSTHLLHLERPDYKPFETSLNVAPDFSRARFTLEPWEGVLIVRTTPDSATVYLEGERIGKTPLERRFKPGSYKIQLEKNGYEPFLRQVLISASSTLVEERLTPTEVLVDLNSTPNGANLFLDHQPLGPTPVTEPLRPGSYRVRIEAPGFNPYEQTVTVTGNEAQQSFDFTLIPAVELGQSLDYYLKKGDSLRQQGQFDKAIQYFTYAASISEPGFNFPKEQIERTRRMQESAAWYTAAEQYLKAGRYQEAAPYVNQIIDLFPDDPRAKNWKRKVENRLASHRLRGKFSIRKDHFNFREIPLVSDLIDKGDSLRSARDLSGWTFQVASKGQGIFALKVSLFTPDQPLLTEQEPLLQEVPIKNFFDVDVRFGGYPILTEWGQVGLFAGGGVSFVTPTDGEKKIIPTIPVGFTFQVFPFRQLFLPAVAPNLPVARIGFEFTFAYSWSPFVDITNEADEVIEQIIYSRSQRGFGLVYRF